MIYDPITKQYTQEPWRTVQCQFALPRKDQEWAERFRNEINWTPSGPIWPAKNRFYGDMVLLGIMAYKAGFRIGKAGDSNHPLVFPLNPPKGVNAE